MSGSGLRRTVESNVLTEVAAELVLSGKACNKGMRIHKSNSHAHWRILIPQLVSFISDFNKELYDLLITPIHL